MPEPLPVAPVRSDDAPKKEEKDSEKGKGKLKNEKESEGEDLVCRSKLL